MGSPVPVISLGANVGLNQKQRRTPLKFREIVLLFLFACQFHSIEGFNHKLFPYGLEESDQNLPTELDDVALPELRLQTPIVFYGNLYPGIYVSLI